MTTTISERSRSLRVATLALLIAAALGPARPHAQSPRSSASPFAGLYQLDGVSTSNDEYRIWFNWTADRFTIQYPDDRDPFEAGMLHADNWAPHITVRCRVDGRAEGFGGPALLDASGSLPMHPDAPDVFGFLSPRFWLTVALFGEFERWPATVSFSAVDPYQTDVTRQRGHYSFARPDISFDAGPTAYVVLERIAAGRGAALSITADRLAVEAHFPERPDLGAAASLMLQYCP